MFKTYANAKDVLPEELFNRLKSEFTGLLYVPGNSGRIPTNVQLVLSMIRAGTPRAKIAATLGITRRRVNQIVAGLRLPVHGEPSDPVASLPQRSCESRNSIADNVGTGGTAD